MPRRAAKVDTTHRAIADHLRAIGFRVYSLAAVGGGMVDLLVTYSGLSFLVECKSAKGKLTPMQEKFHKECTGTIIIARTPEEAAAQLRTEIRYWMAR